MRLSIGSAAILAALMACGLNPARADGVCASPTKVAGFSTCADVAGAEKEGALIVYSTDPEDGTAHLLADFHAAFPKIATNYIRLQAGALYAKVISERQASSYLVDDLQLSDVGFILDFQKRGGFAQYVSPEMAAFKPEYKSTPEGFWTWGAIIMAGIAYNPSAVPPAQAPKSWHDLLDPKWADGVSVKVSNSGLQHETWYELKRLYGDEYWTKFAEQKPRAFDSYVQQYDRAVNGQDKIIATAQYSGYLQFKAKGAPINFVYPADGLPAGPETWGVVANAPHPQAARLFMDWLLSVAGQTSYGTSLFLNSARDDVPPPPGGVKVDKLKLLFPADWNAFLASRTQFARFWDKMTGMR
ncbi:MAG: extracellular solute-binding protein [Acidisphaera sp.]|nr:extracellular solute-binding protein [Acidisphaera sp.]